MKPIDCLYYKKCTHCEDWEEISELSHGFKCVTHYYKCNLNDKKTFAKEICTQHDCLICPFFKDFNEKYEG